jgi:alpha-galactosidase
VWVKKLADGGEAIGLFNRGTAPADMTLKWSDVGVTGKRKIRNLWTHSDESWDAAGFKANVPSHGVALIRVSK